jgi:TPR repeat protein
MLRLAFLLLLFISLPTPVSAADMWKKACEKDLADALSSAITLFKITHEDEGEPRIEVPRKLGVEYAACIDALIAIAEQKDWGRNKRYRQGFISELKSVRDLLKRDLAGVHRLATFYRERDRDALDKILALLLHQWAVEKKYPAAEFEEIQALFADDPGQLAIGWLKLVAGRGYLPAMLDAARRLLNGDGTKKNLGDVYYWIKRAEAAHGDLSGIIEKPFERLLDQMNDEEKKKLLWSSNAFGELALSDPRVSFQVLRRRNYTKKACEERLDWALERIVGMLEDSDELDLKLVARLPRYLGVEYSLCIDELIASSKQLDWGRNKIHQHEFIAELKWTRDLLKGGVEDVYRQAKFYQDRNSGELDRISAFIFHHWAAMNSYTPAEFDEVQVNFAKSVTPRTGGRLKRLANRGYVPAMLDAARRFLKGEGVEKNLGDAYYWIKRVEATHGDISGIIEKPYERLLDQMNDREKASLAQAARFYGPLE